MDEVVLPPDVAPAAPAAPAMDNVVFVEVLDKHEGLLSRHRFEQLPLTLGTSYRSDHIIDVETNDAANVTLTRGEDGVLCIVAADGASDFWAPGGKTRRWRVDPARSIIVAGQRIRVRTRDYTPEASAARATQGNVMRGIGPRAWLWTVPLALLTYAAETWLSDIDGERTAIYVSGGMGIVACLALWSGAWALVSRLTGRASHFLSHVAVAALAIVVVFVLDYFLDTLAFSFNLSIIQRYDWAIVSMVMAALVWCHSYLIARTQARTAALAAMLIGGALFAFQGITFYNLRGDLASTATLSVLRPPAVRVASGTDMDGFFKGAEALKERAEKSRPEKPDGMDLGGLGED